MYVSFRNNFLIATSPPQLINRDPDFRLGCSGGSERPSAREIREHSFFSQAPIDVEEEAQLAREEAERERHREALERSRGPAKGPSSFMETAGTVIRSFSVSTGGCGPAGGVALLGCVALLGEWPRWGCGLDVVWPNWGVWCCNGCGLTGGVAALGV